MPSTFKSSVVAAPSLSAPNVSDARWWTSAPAWMVFVGFALRMAIVFYWKTYHFRAGENHFHFGYEAGSIAGSIATGHGFSSPFGYLTGTGPTTWIAPVYPYLLAGIFKVFGLYSTASAIAILAFNCLCSSVSCATIYLIGKRCFGRAVGLLAGWAFAVIPYFMYWATTWVWEFPFTGLLLSILFLWTLYLDSASLKQWAGFGALWAFTLLVSPAPLTFLPVSLAWCAWKLHQRGVSFAKPVAVAVIVLCAGLAPWLIRNRVEFGQFVFIRGNFGLEFRLGNFANSRGQGWLGNHPTQNARIMQQYRSMGELEFVAAKKNEALDWVKSDPVAFVSLTAQRCIDFWDGEMFNYNPDKYKAWQVLLFSVLALFGLIVALARKQWEALLFGTMLLLFPAPYYITYTHPKYRHPIEPIMMVLAAYFVWGFWTQLRERLAARPEN